MIVLGINSVYHESSASCLIDGQIVSAVEEDRSDKFDYGARVSLIDAFDPDYEKFPFFKTVEPLVVELCPGDVLYIPKGWWHQVKSLDSTISIASFMVTIKDRFSTEFIENLRRFIHNQGWYKKGNCTCHQMGWH